MGGRKHNLLSRFDGLRSDRGANAILLALSMVLLLGIAAVALDLSAAFNERNQDQNAGDNGVMSGALEKAVGNPNDQLIVTQTLNIAQANLTAQFPGGLTDPDWITLWRACVDDGNPGWIPLPEPAAWGGAGTLDCISQTTSLLRVRIPDQLTDTTFGAFMGFDELTTNAVSIAKVALIGTAPPVVPFAVPGGSPNGEHCLSSASDGTAYAPCAGSGTGSFGSIKSPLFADFGTHDPVCTGMVNDVFDRNLIWGLDHRIREWGGATGYTDPSAYPGKQAVLGLADTNRDACQLDPDGNATPVDEIPLNTLRVDTGYPQLTDGLVSNGMEATWGRPSRLQQDPTATRLVSGAEDRYLDNVGPWEFLTDDATGACERAGYSGLPTVDADSSVVTKVSRLQSCLENATGVVFTEDIATSSPRFVWVPEVVFELDNSGEHPNPVKRFRPAFLAGTWFNCPNPKSTQGCAVIFYPDSEFDTPLCDGTYPICKSNPLNVSQLSTWLLPDSSIPQSVWDDFEAAFDNLEPELFQ
jgi:hypothetical protein